MTNAADVLKLLSSALVSLITAGVVAFGAWLARWKIQELSEEQKIKVIGEQRLYIEEKERLLVAMREELDRVQHRCTENTRRQEELDSQILELVRRQHLRERWIRQVTRLCEGAGVTIPPWEES